MLDSIQMLDPRAGNSVITYLNKGLRNDVTRKIETVIEKSYRERNRRLRRRDLAGDKEIEINPNAF